MSHQLTLSLELILLLDWLSKDGKKDLCDVLKKAVSSGAFNNDNNNIDLHSIVLDFVVIIEQALMQELENIPGYISGYKEFGYKEFGSKEFGSKEFGSKEFDDRSLSLEFHKNKKLLKNILVDWEPSSNETVN